MAGGASEANRRLFFAIEIPSPTRTALLDLQQKLRSSGVQAGQWTRPALFHITVHFLGQMSDGVLPQLEAAAHRATAGMTPFSLAFSHVGAFARGGILWAGLAEDDGLAQLCRLYAELRTSLAEVHGVSFESRPYSPHLTLARKLDVQSWTRVANVPDVREGLIQGDPSAAFPVASLSLFESTRQDGQLVYPVIAYSPFTLP